MTYLFQNNMIKIKMIIKYKKNKYLKKSMKIMNKYT